MIDCTEETCCIHENHIPENHNSENQNVNNSITINLMKKHICSEDDCAEIFGEISKTTVLDENGEEHNSEIWGSVPNKSWNPETQKCDKSGMEEQGTVFISNINDEMWNEFLSPDEIVIPDSEYSMRISYPLQDTFTFHFKHEDGTGFTRKQVCQNIGDTYRLIYKEEEETIKDHPVVPLEERRQRGGLMNRNQTDGKYGIWGHDIEDLSIDNLYYNPSDKMLEFFVSS